MWSPLYWYFEIRKDAKYSCELLTEDVAKVLIQTAMLEETGNQSYKTRPSFPWLTVIIVNSDNGNYGLPAQFNSRSVNMISIVGSKSNPANEAFYTSFAMSIGKELNWQVIAEGEGDDGEDIVLREVL